MADTLERSLTSILDQLDERFEVVIADDGSSDDSVKVIKSLQEKYPILRLMELKRDSSRKLGLTRNMSIEEARGEYVLLHLDCDDVWDPYLVDFTKAFHQIEQAAGKDILVSGVQVNIGKRSFLLKHGPYRNIFRGEDRDMWGRFAKMDAYIQFDHKRFMTRLPKNKKQKFTRTILYTWNHMENDFRAGESLKAFLHYESLRKNEMSLKLRALRLLFSLPTYISSHFKEPISKDNSFKCHKEFAAYRDKNRGNLIDILKRFGKEPDFSIFSSTAEEIFK